MLSIGRVFWRAIDPSEGYNVVSNGSSSRSAAAVVRRTEELNFGGGVALKTKPEVASPAQGSQNYFLHIFCILDESANLTLAFKSCSFI